MENRKKALIITLQDSYNYGASLQAFAFKTFLECNGYEVFFSSNEKKGLKKFKNCLKINPRKAFYNFRMNLEYIKFQKKYFVLNDQIDRHFDICFIGSDELWNVENNTFMHDKKYIGEGINADKIITYAVSSNTCDSNAFLKVYPNADRLKRIDDISVRDKDTMSLVKNLNRECVQVLDPTFLIDFDEYIVETPKNVKYLLVYGYIFYNDEIEYIKKIAQNKNLKIYSVGLYQSWVDKNIITSPFGFVNLIRRADYVITSTFHGTVFSIILKKQFQTIVRKNRKIGSLISDLSIEHINCDFSDKYTDIDYNILNKILSEKKDYSKEYIKRCLETETQCIITEKKETMSSKPSDIGVHHHIVTEKNL